MSAIIRVLSGARNGHVVTSDGTEIRVGRGEGVELRFHPKYDLEVSTNHAVISCTADTWRLRDMGSRNGTYVNGLRVEGETALRDGDVITFGGGGPTAQFSLASTDSTRVFATGPAHTSVTAVMRREFTRRTRRWQQISVGTAVVLLAVMWVVLLRAQQQRSDWQRERTMLVARIDSVLTTGEQATHSLQGELQALAVALETSQREVREVRASLERGGDANELTVLRNRLQVALTTLSSRQMAAGIDHESIRRRNDRAVARVFAELPSGEVATGTAFAVRADATLLTNAHVVTAADGSPARRIAIQFSHSDQVWQARVLAVDRAADLAIVKVDDILGAVPVVQPLNMRGDTIVRGAPVLLIGFPNGGAATPTRGGRTVIAPVVGAGSITTYGATQLEVEGYGTTGSSGSPIFDANGEVVGIVFGGRRDGDAHFLVAVPASIAAQLLATLSHR